MVHFFIGCTEIQKNLYLETFFIHFELSTKRNHVNLCQFECIIKPQYLFNRIILKNIRACVNFTNLIVSLNYNITLNRTIEDLYKPSPIWMYHSATILPSIELPRCYKKRCYFECIIRP